VIEQIRAKREEEKTEEEKEFEKAFISREKIIRTPPEQQQRPSQP